MPSAVLLKVAPPALNEPPVTCVDTPVSVAPSGAMRTKLVSRTSACRPARPRKRAAPWVANLESAVVPPSGFSNFSVSAVYAQPATPKAFPAIGSPPETIFWILNVESELEFQKSTGLPWLARYAAEPLN